MPASRSAPKPILLLPILSATCIDSATDTRSVTRRARRAGERAGRPSLVLALATRAIPASLPVKHTRVSQARHNTARYSLSPRRRPRPHHSPLPHARSPSPLLLHRLPSAEATRTRWDPQTTSRSSQASSRLPLRPARPARAHARQPRTSHTLARAGRDRVRRDIAPATRTAHRSQARTPSRQQLHRHPSLRRALVSKRGRSARAR